MIPVPGRKDLDLSGLRSVTQVGSVQSCAICSINLMCKITLGFFQHVLAIYLNSDCFILPCLRILELLAYRLGAAG
jgi:hypothetical protein